MKILDLVLGALGFVIGAAALGYLFYLFVTVVYLGESSSCPLNSC